MSHNKIKVAGQSPNSTGEISVNVSDLSDVTITSAQSGELLQYNGSAWQNTVVPVGQGDFILFGQGESNNYSNSGALNLNAGTTLRLYDTNPVNTISGASLNITSGSGNADENDWLTSIVLPTGEYLLTAGLEATFSATGYLGFKFHDNQYNASHVAYIGNTNNYGTSGSPSFIQSYLKLTSQKTLTLQIHAQSNAAAVSSQGNVISQTGQIMIIQVG